jgi:hypothetical protein
VIPFSVGDYLIMPRPDGRHEVWYEHKSWLLPDKGSLTDLLINRLLELTKENQ